MTAIERSAGILLHPSSLPGPNGIGEIGPEARDFVDILAKCGCKYWQMLPLVPTGFSHSPYSGYSSFAGNPAIISISDVVAMDLLDDDDLGNRPAFNPHRIDFEALDRWKTPLMRKAFERFMHDACSEDQLEFENFCRDQASWLADYALFMALKTNYNNCSWHEWPEKVRMRDEFTISEMRFKLDEEIRYHEFLQYLFHIQWQELRDQCELFGIEMIGDIPIFVDLDSADVWANQQLFCLNADGTPQCVSGVPPDYFCETGQLWGNPLYRWNVHQKSQFAWWIARIKRQLELCHVLRIDHFRGFSAYWSVPAGSPNAIKGEWKQAPGRQFFEALRKAVGGLPFIAEDLGTITEDVHELRREFALPGMRVLLFGFAGEEPKTAYHLPHNYDVNSVVYTGTHDNDTAVGMYWGQDHLADRRSQEQMHNERQNFLAYIDTRDENNIHWKFIRTAMNSVAKVCIIPVQDILGYGSDCRMNRPGHVLRENWSWRLRSFADISQDTCNHLRHLVWCNGRLHLPPDVPVEQKAEELDVIKP